MLTDTTLRHLKPQPKRYKVADRDGLYALVSPSGPISFRYDYRLNGRRETFVIGPYNPRGLTLALAREKCMRARSALEPGESPAQTKRNDKERLDATKTFCEYAEDWFDGAGLTDSTKAMRRAVYNRDIYPKFKKESWHSSTTVCYHPSPSISMTFRTRMLCSSAWSYFAERSRSRLIRYLWQIRLPSCSNIRRLRVLH